MNGWQRLEKQLVTTLRAHLQGQRMRIPEAGLLIWGWFIELHGTRTYHAAGPHPIAHAEIEAWQHLTGWTIKAHHIAVLRALDAVYLEHAYSKAADRSGGKIAPRGSGQAINPAVFDAVFG